jgi:acyl carrier protein
VDAKKLQLVQKLVAEQIKVTGLGDVDWQQSLTSLGLDELDLIELTIKLEDAFKVEITDLAISGGLTVDGLMASLNL